MKLFHVGVTGNAGFNDRLAHFMRYNDKSVSVHDETHVLTKKLPDYVQKSISNIDCFLQPKKVMNPRGSMSMKNSLSTENPPTVFGKINVP